jgi:hypothetical protein
MDYSVACLPAARGLQLESCRSWHIHTHRNRAMYSGSHGAGGGGTGCRIRKTCIGVRERGSGEQWEASQWLW